MNPVFADTSYWIALIFLRDTRHTQALALTQKIATERRGILTTQMVLTEFLNFFAAFGPVWRDTTIAFVQNILADPNTTVIETTGELFLKAVNLYAQRRDEEWGLTDCASFVLMAEQGIVDALTHDHHFQQAGFIPLMRDTTP